MDKFDQEMKEINGSSGKPESDEKEKVSRGLLGMLFEHADWSDMVLMALGTCGCFVDGLSVSIMMLVFSHLMNVYASVSSLTPADVNKVSCPCQQINYRRCRMLLANHHIHRFCSMLSRLSTSLLVWVQALF